MSDQPLFSFYLDDAFVHLVYNNSAIELKLNLCKYLLLTETEDIFITRNGKTINSCQSVHIEAILKSLYLM